MGASVVIIVSVGPVEGISAVGVSVVRIISVGPVEGISVVGASVVARVRSLGSAVITVGIAVGVVVGSDDFGD